MKGLGKGVKSFKEGMAGLEDEINKPTTPDPSKQPEKDKPPEKAG
jgi:sec-independent protein translocase protein TatA